MKKSIWKILLMFIFAVSMFPYAAHAQQPAQPEYNTATVTKIVDSGYKKIGDSNNLFQTIQVHFENGRDEGNTVTLEHGGLFTITEEQKLNVGEKVIISKLKINNQTQYRIADIYRLRGVSIILFCFFLLVVLIAGKKGFGSFIGMLLSLAIIVLYIVPQIINGANPLLIALIGSFLIMVTTIYLAHGFSQQTSIAIMATLISLIFTISLSFLFVQLASLSGIGSEDIFALAQGFGGKINFHGLLLGGIIIGVLGVLDDITTTQTTTIFTLAAANPRYTAWDLFSKGMIIGREHIVSLVNTLVLAYAGASMGMFIFLIQSVKMQNQPLWVILNSELISEEVVRTLVGSVSLILAVPITTLLASFFARYSLKIK